MRGDTVPGGSPVPGPGLGEHHSRDDATSHQRAHGRKATSGRAEGACDKSHEGQD